MSCNLFERGFASLKPKLLAALGTDAIHVRYVDGEPVGRYHVRGVIEQPAMFEDQIPGSTLGVSNLYFWVDYAALSPRPDQGDQVEINGVVNDVIRIEVGLDGGATLSLKRVE